MQKKGNLRIYITFAVMVLICFVTGYMAGKGGAHLQESIDSINWGVVSANLILLFTIVFCVLIGFSFLLCILYYSNIKRNIRELENLTDEEFETKLPVQEIRLAKIVIVNNITLILSLVFYPLILLCQETANVTPDGKICAITANIVFVLELAFMMVLNVLVVGMEKKLNPEKEGNVFDIHFRRKWYASMDEGEILKTAKASAKAYNAGMVTCFVLWVISLATMLVFHTGIWPIICLSVIMLVMNLVGTLDSMK